MSAEDAGLVRGGVKEQIDLSGASKIRFESVPLGRNAFQP
jgi:hypothetical protein